MPTMTRSDECTAPTATNRLLLAFELGERTWKLGFTTGVGQRPRLRQIPAGAGERLLEEIARAKVRLQLPVDTPVISCYEAGRTRIAFDSNLTGPRELYVKAASGAGVEEVLVASPQAKVPTDWSADGRLLLYFSVDPQTNRDVWVLPLALRPSTGSGRPDLVEGREPQGHPEQGRGMEGDRTPWVFLKTPFDERDGTFSPDGRWVAYVSNESGRYEIYIRPFAGPAASGAFLRQGSGQAASQVGGQWQVSTAGGISPRWRRDGRELCYLAPNGMLMASPISATGSTLAPGAPVALFPTRVVGGGTDTSQGPQYDVTRDGRFLINTVLDEAAAPITLIQNWNPEAKQ